jgi:predicted PhzF superfamily epimerase YddE/YHI9
VGAVASKSDIAGETYRLQIKQGVAMGRSSFIEAVAYKSDRAVTSITVGGATSFVASGEIEVPFRRSADHIREVVIDGLPLV